MPVARQYSGGSIVYFQGDKGDEIYILQQGRVIMITTALDTGEEIKHDVQKGEFFGVKSSLGRYPREETAQVLGKTTVLVFKQIEFEKLVLKNTRLIMKMLGVFSKQLRDVHRQVREIMNTGAAREPAFELMNTAESFYRSGQIDHSIYVFSKYLEHYPGGRYTDRAKELLQMAQRGQTYPIGYAPIEESPGSDRSKSADIVGQGMRPAEQSVEDPFALNVSPATEAISDKESISDIFYAGLDAFSKEDYQTALKKYKEVLDSSESAKQEDAEFLNKAQFEKARSEMKLTQFDAATATLSTYLKKFPTGEFVKDSIFQLGVIAEIRKDKDRARSLYHKVATMQPVDSVTREARKRLEKLG